MEGIREIRIRVAPQPHAIRTKCFGQCTVSEDCRESVSDDATEERVQGTTVARKPYLLVSREFGASVPSVEYCYDAAASFKSDLLRRITAGR